MYVFKEGDVRGSVLHIFMIVHKPVLHIASIGFPMDYT